MRTKAPDQLYVCAPRLNQLLILSALGDDPFLTQAVLAAKCKLSVAMVNNYLKELCEAGLIEYRRKSLKSVSYHLTDLGRAQLEVLESELTGDAIERFAHAKERMVHRILCQNPKTPLHRVVLYGSGHLAELVFLALGRVDVRVIAMCDDERRIGPEWCGCPVVDSTAIAGLHPDAVIISDWHHTDTAWHRLNELFGGSIRLIRLDGHPAHCPAQDAESPEPHYTLPWRVSSP